MKDNLEIRFRKDKGGAEAALVNEFLNYYENLFKKEGLQYTILTETYAEIGIPDILIVAWDKNTKDSWAPERNNLNKTDIKILHHISSSGKHGLLLSEISIQLGFNNNKLQKSLKKLVSANLMSVEDEKFSLKNFEEAFFLRKIISIEAKIKNWKIAFEQAKLNENFCSHSYVLLPNEVINKNVISSNSGNVGILAHKGDSAIFKRKAKMSKIPGSYFSWVLNEYVGRLFFNSASHVL